MCEKVTQMIFCVDMCYLFVLFFGFDKKIGVSF